MLLNVTGVLFASQLATLMFLGPYADYGNWRPWIMIGTSKSTHPLAPIEFLTDSLRSRANYLVHLSIRHVRHQQTWPVGERPSIICGGISSSERRQLVLRRDLPIASARSAKGHSIGR
jgi:hypothetical protein